MVLGTWARRPRSFKRVGLFVRVIGTADERTGFNVAKAELNGALSQLVKFTGMVIANDWQMRE